MRKVVGAALTLLVALAACEDFASPTGSDDDQDPTPTDGAEEFSIQQVSGDDQKGIMGAALLDSLVVEVTDTDGVPVEGVNVRWKVVSADGGGVNVSGTTQTNVNGLTYNWWRLGNAPQATDSLIAFIGSSTVAPDTVMFSALVTGVPDTILVTQGAVEMDNDFNEPELLVGDTVFAATGGWSRKPFKAIVLDAAGDSVRGARLTWTTTSGGGLVGDEPDGGSGTVHVITDEAGGITVWRQAPTLDELQELAPGCVDEDEDGNLFLRTDVQCWIGATLSMEDYPEVTPVTLDALLRN